MHFLGNATFAVRDEDHTHSCLVWMFGMVYISQSYYFFANPVLTAHCPLTLMLWPFRLPVEVIAGDANRLKPGSASVFTLHHSNFYETRWKVVLTVWRFKAFLQHITHFQPNRSPWLLLNAETNYLWRPLACTFSLLFCSFYKRKGHVTLPFQTSFNDVNIKKGTSYKLIFMLKVIFYSTGLHGVVESHFGAELSVGTVTLITGKYLLLPHPCWVFCFIVHLKHPWVKLNSWPNLNIQTSTPIIHNIKSLKWYPPRFCVMLAPPG